MQRHAMRLPVLFLLVTGVLGAVTAGGCGRKKVDAPADDSLFQRGRARVVSVNSAIGQATLEINGKHVQAYWDLEQASAQGGSVVRPGPFKAPVGDYREPLVQVQDLPAQPGDVIVFVAMKTGNSLFLRGVQVVGR